MSMSMQSASKQPVARFTAPPRIFPASAASVSPPTRTGRCSTSLKTASDEERAPAAPGTPGHVGWHELHAGDGPSAFAFYSGLFGWTKAEAMDMGPMGVYQIFATGGAPRPFESRPVRQSSYLAGST